MTIIKIIIHFFMVVGLILAVGDLLNWYKDSDRISFFQIISDNHKCPPDHPGAQKFLKSFLYNLPLAEERNKKIENIIFTGLFEKGGGRQATLSGSIKIKTTDGYVSKELCSFNELRSWSKEAPFWKWIAWSFLAIGVILETIIFVVELLKSKRPI